MLDCWASWSERRLDQSPRPTVLANRFGGVCLTIFALTWAGLAGGTRTVQPDGGRCLGKLCSVGRDDAPASTSGWAEAVRDDEAAVRAAGVREACERTKMITWNCLEDKERNPSSIRITSCYIRNIYSWDNMR